IPSSLPVDLVFHPVIALLRGDLVVWRLVNEIQSIRISSSNQLRDCFTAFAMTKNWSLRTAVLGDLAIHSVIAYSVSVRLPSLFSP
ncbi:MAG: hypothetical protein WBI14_09680, partial [Anaerolineaceae bacterium]